MVDLHSKHMVYDFNDRIWIGVLQYIDLRYVCVGISLVVYFFTFFLNISMIMVGFAGEDVEGLRARMWVYNRGC